MKIVFFGSPSDAEPALRAVTRKPFDVLAVYTRPDKPAGRSRSPVPTPVRTAAEQLGLPVRTPASLRDTKAVDELRELEADAFVVVAYGRILPPETLAIPRLGAVNIHPSLLPKYRGPSPVASAIRDGMAETGVTLMLLDEGMDTGPVLLQERVPLDGTERCSALTSSLFELGADLLPGVLMGLDNGSITPTPQDESQATLTRLLSREDGALDWSRSAAELERLVRAYDPWPGTHTTWKGRMLKIIDAAVSGEQLEPGVVSARDSSLLVGCGRGSLELRTVQAEGRRAVGAQDFLNGNPSFGGARLPS